VRLFRQPTADEIAARLAADAARAAIEHEASAEHHAALAAMYKARAARLGVPKPEKSK
jgi:hypothetical protein